MLFNKYAIFVRSNSDCPKPDKCRLCFDDAIKRAKTKLGGVNKNASKICVEMLFVKMCTVWTCAKQVRENLVVICKLIIMMPQNNSDSAIANSS